MESTVLVGAAYWDRAVVGANTHGLFSLDRADGAWRPVTEGLPEAVEVRCIVLRDPDTIFVGTQFGPCRSDDGGRSWTLLELPGPERVVWSILPHGDDVLYVGAQGTAVYKSIDDGATWRQLPVPAPVGQVTMGFAMRVIRLAVDPANADELYLAFEVGGVVRSLDGGETWSDCSAGLLELARQDHLRSAIGSDTDTEGMMDSHAMVVSAARPGTVFLATRMGLFRSPDKGESWHEMEIGRFSELTYARDLQVLPKDPDTLLGAFSLSAASGPGSLYRSRDLGETWTRYDHDVSIDSTLMAVAASANDARRVYCAARRGQVFGTEDDGANWREYPLPAGVEGIYAVACA